MAQPLAAPTPTYRPPHLRVVEPPPRPTLTSRLAGMMRAWARRMVPDFDARVAALEADVNEVGIEPTGFDPSFVADLLAPAVWLYRSYFRAETTGLENLPDGPCLLVANHGGQIPMDGTMIAMALFLETERPRFVRAMIERWIPTLPFVSMLFSRSGQLVGTKDNGLWALTHGKTVLVFPEGARGMNKPWSRRYRLEPFPTGFVRLALEANVPIVPVAVVGAEEQYISVANLTGLGRRLGVPSLPVIPQVLVPFVGVLPLPVRYRIELGAPIWPEGDADDEEEVVAVRAAEVQATIQGMVNAGLERRRSVFF